jgi:hypothetical protein
MGGVALDSLTSLLVEFESLPRVASMRSIFLSPSTALYIPFDVCCTYVSTSHIRSTSCTSRVASGYGDGTPSMVAGRRYEMYAWFSAPAGREKEPGAAPKPPLKLVDCARSTLLVAYQGHISTLHPP